MTHYDDNYITVIMMMTYDMGLVDKKTSIKVYEMTANALKM